MIALSSMGLALASERSTRHALQRMRVVSVRCICHVDMSRSCRFKEDQVLDWEGSLQNLHTPIQFVFLPHGYETRMLPFEGLEGRDHRLSPSSNLSPAHEEFRHSLV